jgi:hypothetical protein
MAKVCAFDCGVNAVGLCVQCERPFCVSHRSHRLATMYRQFPAFSNVCAPCHVGQVELATREDRRRYYGSSWLLDGSASAALREAGVSADVTVLERRLVVSERGRPGGLFRRATKDTWGWEVTRRFGGWPLGTSTYETGQERYESLQTVLLAESAPQVGALVGARQDGGDWVFVADVSRQSVRPHIVDAAVALLGPDHVPGWYEEPPFEVNGHLVIS